VVTKESLDYGTIATQAELLTYQNEEYGYSVSYPKDWYYKETGGTYFSQATGFNPNGVGAEDYQAMVAVLSVDRQTYLNSLDDNSNLKIVREYDVLIDNQLGVKYTYQNISTDSTFSIHILTFNDTNYLITADESVEDTFVGSFAIQAELEMAFDACGKLTAYQDYAWFNTLNQKYEDEFLVPQDLSGDVGGDFGEGCLTLDESLFIFIPEYFEFGCGKVFSYDVKNDILKTPDHQYCASKFGQRVNNYVLFSGNEGDGGTCKKYDGKYYFLENRVETTTGSC